MAIKSSQNTAKATMGLCNAFENGQMVASISRDAKQFDDYSKLLNKAIKAGEITVDVTLPTGERVYAVEPTLSVEDAPLPGQKLIININRK